MFPSTENEFKIDDSDQVSVSNHSEAGSISEENFRPLIVDQIIEKFDAEIIN